MQIVRTFRIPPLVTALALATAAACGPGRPAPLPEQWVVLREDAEQRASLDLLSLRIEPGDLRRATVAVDYAAPREKDDVRFDQERTELQFDCRGQRMRAEGGSRYLGGELASAWDPGPNPVPWEKVPPGSYLGEAMKRICRIAP
jgi:hypothetical protein